MAAAFSRSVRPSRWRTRAELSEAPHGAAQVAEDRWRRVVDDVPRRLGRSSRCRGALYREAEAALDALRAAYGGAVPVAVVQRIEAYVLRLLNRGIPPGGGRP